MSILAMHFDYLKWALSQVNIGEKETLRDSVVGLVGQQRPLQTRLVVRLSFRTHLSPTFPVNLPSGLRPRDARAPDLGVPWRESRCRIRLGMYLD